MEKLFVIKIGGNVIDDDTALQTFLQSFTLVNAKKILVHGGGKIATSMGKQLGIEPNYVDGRRITDEATIDLVTMVYGGLINKKIIAKLQSLNCNAIGLTGADANIIPTIKRPAKEIDYGFVGDINTGQLATDNLQLFLENGLVPVVTPLSMAAKALSIFGRIPSANFLSSNSCWYFSLVIKLITEFSLSTFSNTPFFSKQ